MKRRSTTFESPSLARVPSSGRRWPRKPPPDVALGPLLFRLPSLLSPLLSPLASHFSPLAFRISSPLTLTPTRHFHSPSPPMSTWGEVKGFGSLTRRTTKACLCEQTFDAVFFVVNPNNNNTRIVCCLRPLNRFAETTQRFLEIGGGILTKRWPPFGSPLTFLPLNLPLNVPIESKSPG